MTKVIGAALIVVGLVAVIVAGYNPGWFIFAIGAIVFSLRLHANTDSSVVTTSEPEADTEDDDEDEEDDEYRVVDKTNGIYQIVSPWSWADTFTRFKSEHPDLRIVTAMLDNDEDYGDNVVLCVVTEPRS